jgi:hypothetical protein
VELIGAKVLRYKLHSRSAEAQVKDSEVTKYHEGDRENSITACAEALHNSRHGQNTDKHWQSLPEQIEDAVFCEKAPAFTSMKCHFE